MSRFIADPIGMFRKALPKVAMYLMLGYVLGFIFFYDLWPYFSVPAAANLPVTLLILALCSAGFLAGYMHPDITHVLAGSIIMPLLGFGFCALMVSSPVLSPDIVMEGFSEGMVGLALLVMPYMVITFLILFITGFFAMYLFEE